MFFKGVNYMRKYIDIMLRAILTGFAIGIGGIVNLSCDNKYIGAFLFGTGLFVILTFGFSLFTGKVGYAVEKKPIYLIELVVIWIGNFIGTFITGIVIQMTRVGSDLSMKAEKICMTKMNDSVVSILVLAFFCGMLMFIAADGYKNIKNNFAQMLVVFLPVMVFILCGFEHCVANMFYFTVANMWDTGSVFYLIVMSVGNGLGGIFIPLMRKGFVKE